MYAWNGQWQDAMDFQHVPCRHEAGHVERSGLERGGHVDLHHRRHLGSGPHGQQILYLIYYNSSYDSTTGVTCGPIVYQLSGNSLVSVGKLCSISNGDDVEYVSGRSRTSRAAARCPIQIRPTSGLPESRNSSRRIPKALFGRINWLPRTCRRCARRWISAISTGPNAF